MTSTLEQRVAVLEAEVRGEQIVTRHILRKVGEITETLHAQQQQISSLQRDVSRLADSMALVQAKLEALPAQIAQIVGEALREAGAAHIPVQGEIS
jgi:uncharacterized protein YoxC